jgi:hypothetical protein
MHNYWIGVRPVYTCAISEAGSRGNIAPRSFGGAVQNTRYNDHQQSTMAKTNDFLRESSSINLCFIRNDLVDLKKIEAPSTQSRSPDAKADGQIRL